MSSDFSRPMLVDAALDLLPPMIRRALLHDKPFLKQWDISTITVVTLGKHGLSFRRDRLYDSIRSAIRNLGREVPVLDQNGASWDLVAQPQGESIVFSVCASGVCHFIPNHSALSEDATVRITWFERAAIENNFKDPAYHSWQQCLLVAPLDDDEFSDLIADMELTPTSVYRTLRASMERATFDVSTLVPNDRRYYERLVGPLGSASSVAAYLESGLKPLISDLLSWTNIHGLRYALLECSVGKIVDIFNIEDLDREELRQTFLWLIEHGDPISRIGAVEVALSHLDAYPELAPLVELMVEGFIADDPTNDGGDFALLSAMIVLVASEMTMRRTLADAPPFYRKQAAIAQASLVIRAIKESSIDSASITQWILSAGTSHIFFLQGLLDLRREPRWLPDFVKADQLRAEFVGRVANAAGQNEAKIQSESLRALLFGVGSKLMAAARWPLPNLPGPLEGEITPRRPIPVDILTEATAALEANRLGANSFGLLVNAALLFDLPKGQSDIVASALRRVKFSIEDADDSVTAFSLIGGLAIVAAVERGTNLADALRILSRVLRRRRQLSISLDDELRVAMIAAASYECSEDWARFAGEWITEIAFEASSKEQAGPFLAQLRRLVQIEPALTRHVSAADAALVAFTH